jgi:hypothetical protein
MNSAEKQKTMTVFSCGSCGYEHARRELAEECCVCAVCGKRPATVKEHSFDRSPSMCDRCSIAKTRKQVRDRADRIAARIAKLESELQTSRRELSNAEAEFQALGGKRREEKVA